jgi:TetR/AcrR family transcriptional regulator, regulator of autoinduction and epiphytic fitness
MNPVELKSSGRQLSPEKAEAILNGAMQEFLACGYTATSMDRIASAAGVSKATVYNHFQDKEGLFEALTQQLVQTKFRDIFGSCDIHELQGDPRVVLRQLALSILETDPQVLDFMRLVMGESGRFPELARAFVRTIDGEAFKFLRQYFHDHATELNLSDPEATARIFIGTVVHHKIVQTMLHGADIVPMDRDRLIDSLIQMITQGMNNVDI